MTRKLLILQYYKILGVIITDIYAVMNCSIRQSICVLISNGIVLLNEPCSMFRTLVHINFYHSSYIYVKNLFVLDNFIYLSQVSLSV